MIPYTHFYGLNPSYLTLSQLAVAETSKVPPELENSSLSYPPLSSDHAVSESTNMVDLTRLKNSNNQQVVSYENTQASQARNKNMNNGLLQKKVNTYEKVNTYAKQQMNNSESTNCLKDEPELDISGFKNFYSGKLNGTNNIPFENILENYHTTAQIYWVCRGYLLSTKDKPTEKTKLINNFFLVNFKIKHSDQDLINITRGYQCGFRNGYQRKPYDEFKFPKMEPKENIVYQKWFKIGYDEAYYKNEKLNTEIFNISTNTNKRKGEFLESTEPPKKNKII